MRFRRNNTIKILLVPCLIWYLFFALPSPLFNAPTSTVLFDRNQQLLAAKLASDEQWRFPLIDSIPKKFEICLLQFEDAYFRYHPGVNPVAIGKAAFSNFKNNRVVRGGSTITMQTMRLARAKKKRNIYQKIIEIILATRLELTHSKDEILKFYVSNTPYGGNVVGLETASWRYFGRSAHQLSWAETATLAVLPNAPSLMYPGKNKLKLKAKRDRLLDKLKNLNIIEEKTWFLAKQEPIPDRPKPLPKQSAHLLQHVIKKGYKGQLITTTIDKNIQSQSLNIVQQHSKQLHSNHIYNAACLIIEVATGNVISYIGNTPQQQKDKGQDVDVIVAPRSTGSVLKPFLYAASIADGSILPQTLLPDIPTQIAGYSPQNYHHTYDGAVPAYQALSRSLNIPAVHLLRDYRYERFHGLMRKLGVSTLNKPADHYGLSMILGGAEGSLWELSGIYASLGRGLLPEFESEEQNFMQRPNFIKNIKQVRYASALDKASIYLMLEAMREVNRPSQEEGWQYFDHSQPIGWKTGTSFGNRDAWAIGVSPDYVVGVWVGNADGEGRAQLTGVQCAAPIMFDVFKQFKIKKWFDQPLGELFDIEICSQSGYKAGDLCEKKETILSHKKGINSKICPYHHLIHLSKNRKYQVNSSCAEPYEITHESWFVLPPTIEWYYQKKHIDYFPLPKFKEGCSENQVSIMGVIYPRNLAKVFIPRELDGELGELVFKIAHRDSRTTLFWHLDQQYIGQTHHFHELAIQPKIGKHKLTLVDVKGNRLEKYFEVFE